MSEPDPPKRIRFYQRKDNFLAVVVLSGLFLVLFLVCAYFVVGGDGTRLLPRVHPRNAEPTSYLAQPTSTMVDA